MKQIIDAYGSNDHLQIRNISWENIFHLQLGEKN